MNDGEPLPVSVLIPAYNSEAFIEETVRSALAQREVAFEIIAVDDGSTDGTANCLRRFSDPRLRVIRQDNQGPGEALNAGLREARGKFIAFLDHDDLWRADKLQRHVEYMERNPAADLTFSWSGFIDDAGRRLGLHSRKCAGVISFRQLVIDFVIGNTSSVVARSEAIRQAGLFDGSFRMYFNEDLFLRVAHIRPGNVHAIPEELTLYRRHAGQMSRDWRGMNLEWERLVEKLRRLAPEDMSRIEARSKSNMYRYFSYLAHESGELAASARLLGKGFCCCPVSFVLDRRNWKMGAGCLSALLLPGALYRSLLRLARIR
jgi:glycosyltransferase involved in cell wall biosynthesis